MAEAACFAALDSNQVYSTTSLLLVMCCVGSRFCDELPTDTGNMKICFTLHMLLPVLVECVAIVASSTV